MTTSNTKAAGAATPTAHTNHQTTTDQDSPSYYPFHALAAILLALAYTANCYQLHAEALGLCALAGCIEHGLPELRRRIPALPQLAQRHAATGAARHRTARTLPHGRRHSPRPGRTPIRTTVMEGLA